MQPYVELVKHVLAFGESREDRTQTGTLSVFGYQSRYNLSEGFPLLTLKRTHFRSIVHELLWFLKGDTNIHYLNQNGVSIWDEWADGYGDLGPVYGKQWRSWDTGHECPIDQIANVIESIRNDPYSRRHIVSAWNVSEIEHMALPPCHLLFQFYVSRGKLSCHLYQRSADIFLGVPFNIASYALLTMMIAQVCDLEVGDFVHTLGDAHIYSNHIPQIREMLSREELPPPKVVLDPTIKNIDDFKYESIALLDYHYHPTIKAKVAV